MVYLYANKLPNYGINTHVLFSNFAAYNEWLGTPIMQFDEDRATINGNIAEIAIPAGGSWEEITYLSWNNGGTWRYYFVRSSVWQSGYAILSLELDYWATFIPFANISNIVVKRCNRAIGRGVYDDIAVTFGGSPLRLDDSEMTEEQINVVFVVAMATGKSTILSNQAATALGIYRFNVGDIPTPDPMPAGFSKLSEALDRVSGITSVSIFDGSTVIQVDANVLKAYIVPSSMTLSSNIYTPKFNYVGRYSRGEFHPTATIAQGEVKRHLTININPNYKYYVGTRYNGLEITRETETTGISYCFIYGQDSLKVRVEQGDKMLDITNAFEVGLTSNDGNYTSMQKIAGLLQSISGVTSGAFQIASGGVGYVSGALTIGNSLLALSKEGNARYSPGGDGLSNFLPNISSNAPPYYATIYSSTIDEKAHARLYGATFNEQISAIDSVFNFELLGAGDLNDTFISADCRIDGIPLNARDVIAEAFSNGIYIIKV